MPYLNWKESTLRQEVLVHPCLERKMILTLSFEEAQRLALSLGEVFSKLGSELRVDLPNQWIIFWKTRESESRFLLAHPQEGEWVATVAVEPGFAAQIVENLRAIRPGESMRLSELGVLGPVSNMELELALRSSS